MTDSIALAAKIRAGEMSVVEAVEAAIARAEAVDKELNAIIAPQFERASQAAAAATNDHRPLGGVPFVMKDLGGPIAGDPAPNGNRVLRNVDHRHSFTGAVGRRLLAAGAISLGRSHSPEFGSGNCPASSETLAFGSTRNPWDSSLTPMGSSGGSAAAVAAGIVPIAHATDGGGSIRMPASACGVVGLKPSRGRVSSAPATPGWAGGATEGAITRTVRDAALLLDILAGAEPGGDLSAEPHPRGYLAAIELPPEPMRFGVLGAVPYAATHPDCRAAVDKTVALLSQLGHHIDYDTSPSKLESLEYLYDYIAVIRANGAALLAAEERTIGRPWTESDVEDGTWVNYQRGLKVSAADYISALDRMHSFSVSVVRWWDRYDLLVTPTLATPPPRLGYLVEGDDRQRRERLGVTMPFTAQFNVTGQPAVSLPLHWNDAGVPIGVQLVAAPFREDLLLRVAAQLEAAQPWHHRYTGALG